MSDHAPEVAALIGLVDRLEALLERSNLAEIEVEHGGTAIVVRRPVALAVPVAVAAPAATAAGAAATPASPPVAAASAAPVTSHHAVIAPLTGVFYASPSPGAAPYVSVGGHVSAGQVIGLIEAMKLFNEIKSDTSGTVRRISAESGQLVKAKQVLIEVEPT